MPKPALETCAKIVQAATAHCSAVPLPAPVPAPSEPNFDALAASLTSQSNAIAQQALYLTLFGVLVAVAAIVGAISWARHVKAVAKEEARIAAREEAIAEINRLAPQLMDRWLSTEGIAALRQASQMAQPTTTTDDVADEIAQSAGDQ